MRLEKEMAFAARKVNMNGLNAREKNKSKGDKKQRQRRIKM